MATNGNTVSFEQSAKMDMYKVSTSHPKWMTREYVENVLKESEKDLSLKLGDYEIVSATKPGDNFASVALRLRAAYRTKGKDVKKSFIVKVEHYEEGFKKDMMSEAVLFETEIMMYAQTIPEMQRLIREVDPKETIAPPVAYYNLKPHKIVFLEDISPEFYVYEVQLTFEESVEVFKKIGTFHALSVFMGENHKPMKSYTNGFISPKIEGTGAFLVATLGTFTDAIAEWGPEMKIVAEKLKGLQPTIFQKLIKIFVKNEGAGYNVLNHGDFHLKNILFRNQKDFPNLNDFTRLIDFQLSIWATPAIDLFFALYGMVGHEARERREELIRLYHEHFTTTLLKLGYLKAPPSLLDLQVELLRNGLLEVFMVTFFMPMIYQDHKKVAEMGEITIEQMNQMRKDVLNLPELKSILMKLLPTFLYKGYLEE